MNLLDAVDPVAIVLELLHHCPAATAIGRSGLNEGPYPHIQVRPGGGGAGPSRPRWQLTEEVTLDVWGAPDGTPGSQALRALLVECVRWLCQRPEQPHTPGGPVLSDVEVAGSVRWSPDPATGQPRWSATLRVTAHPEP